MQNNDLTKAAYWQRLQKQYMRQFLVNQLSSRGLIPTYSFPVHSLTLEVMREITNVIGFNRSEITLTRDANLGLSEYAPGSEVVANGRIWQSKRDSFLSPSVHAYFMACHLPAMSACGYCQCKRRHTNTLYSMWQQYF